jgi:hypothetical protein
VHAVTIAEGERTRGVGRGRVGRADDRQEGGGRHCDPLVGEQALPETNATRPPGRSAVARFVNAATGSTKNITPNRLIRTSKLPASLRKS